MAKDNIYVSLDEAREEIKKRWNDEALRKKIEDELGSNFMPSFRDMPRSVIGKPLASPDNGFMFFVQCAHYINTTPLFLEYLNDTFITINKEKAGLGRLRVWLKENPKALIDMVDFKVSDKKKISEVVMKNNEKLVNFHHKLIKISEYNIETDDMTSWACRFNGPSDYYYPYLLHFIAHGVLFENFQISEDEREDVFTNSIIMPTIKRITRKFGLKPLIIRLYPKQQTEEEDFYWWCYPPSINNYIVNYAKKNNFSFRHLKS